MRGHFHPPLSPVLSDDTLCVDGQATVGIDGHTEKPGVGLLKQKQCFFYTWGNVFMNIIENTGSITKDQYFVMLSVLSFEQSIA